ncbi:sorbosone dehydrogenase family protein [Nocardioides sp. zg-DK7169]|uniref:PQQ-dependent sugar dehydrogenase n=1 Tax=Nocardioides sp. zg-DK7169 TaxID=2736600 RepID=UPI003464C3EA
MAGPGRRSALALGALLVPLALAGCGQGGNEVEYDVTPTASDSPTDAASNDGSAAGDPSTGTGGPSITGSPGEEATASARPRVVGTVATGLEAPWGLAFLPDGDALVTERDSGRVLRISGPRHRVTEVGTVEEAAPEGESGLLGVAVSPDFAEDAQVFLYVTTAEDNRVVRATLRDDGLGDLEPILTGIPSDFIHDGGRLLFGPDGHLYVSTGDANESARAQDRESLGGKILRITTDGDPAPGNPLGTPLWSWGHRNVQGLAFVGDQLWASEFGANEFDELNRIEAGANYGWPEVEGTGGKGQGFVDPQATWATSEASPSGLAYAAGHLWMAALRGERLWRIPVEGDRAGEPRSFLVGRYGRMRTIAVAPDGMLWLTTSNRDGRGTPAEGDDRILLVRP